ncbi:MAG: UDP-N-acetylmuramoyl-tripeptide--D-alanyl-D-alanine ligase, partial [Clostridia bacterium]|nr:UDP-N-acetylmuramoyl-tripeptide--D-alanyl-D-alanine ligase [Clostridia bacterium]
MMTLTLSEIALAVGGELFGNGEKTICGISTDSRKTMPEEIFIALRGEKFDGHDFIQDLWGKCSAVITEEPAPGFDGVLVPDTLKALGALSAYWKKKVAPKITVGVTGSVGKTTTKELIASVLKEKYKTHCTAGNFNNHIGVPITLIRIEKGTEAVVCEMGMNHKGELSYLTSLVESDMAIITNIGHSHIENLGSRENIRNAKMEITEGVKRGGVLIVNGDEPLLDDIAFDGRIVRVGLKEGLDVWAEDISMSDTQVEYTLYAFGQKDRVVLPCTGKHNVVDSLFAVAAGCLEGISL